ncbi:VCBS repeat-containing protein [Streptomyces hebeiensis]|uniref:VCBS repeat-containing protein n=1 Tax=Streptomyces hebeiensis TaxID=229486 RepID=A0ABP4FXW2_9ACTN
MPDMFRRRRGAARRSAGTTITALVISGALGLTPTAVAAPGTAPAAAPEKASNSPAAPATSEADALARAQRSGEPVEVVSARTETSEVYAQPGGTLKLTQHTMPVRVKREGAWKAIDTTLAPAQDRVAPKAAAGHVTFSAGGSEPLVVLRDQGRTLSLTWPNALPAPVLEGATATYREVLPGVDLALKADVDGFSQALIVKTAEAANNPELETIDFGLSSDGLDLRKDPESGSLKALNPAGQTVFATSSARMWDSTTAPESAPPALAPTAAGPKAAAKTAAESSATAPDSASAPDTAGGGLTPGANSASVGVTVLDGTLRLEPDQKLLDAPTTTYPVYIDPRFTGQRQAWTIAYKPHPNDSYWNGTGWDGKTTNEARVGYESSSGGTARSFFRIDSKALAGVKVIDAQFQITETHSWSCTPKPVELWQTGAISSATTWNKQPSWADRQDTRNYAHGNEGVGCPDKAVDFTATKAAVNAAAKNWPSITFGLRAPQSAEDNKDTYSWKKFKPDAKLIVEYNRLPKNPWALDTIPSTKSPLNDCGNNGSYVTVGNTDVTLTAQVWDQDGGDVNVQFHLWATGKHDGDPGVFFDKKVKVAVKASDSKGARASVVVPKTLLNQYKGLSNGQFSWKAQAEDPNDASYASDWTPTLGAPGCRFAFDPTAPAVSPTVASAEYPEDTDGALARTEGTFTIGSGGVADVTEYRWSLDRTPANIVVKPAAPGGGVSIKVTPLSPGPHTVYVQSVDAGKNTSPTYPYKFYAASPGLRDKPGDVNGDGAPDFYAVDGTNNLRLYSGTDTKGNVGAASFLSTNGAWEGALLTHRGDWTEDGYEDLVARRKDGKLWLFPNDGLGQVSEDTRQPVYVFPDEETGAVTDTAAIKQIVSVGDLTPDSEQYNPDFVAVIGDQLWFLPGYTGGTLESGYPIGNSGWGAMTLVSPGDVDGDGLVDLMARHTNGTLYVYHGTALDVDADGVPDGGTDPSAFGAPVNRTVHATGWTPAARPLITAPGDVDGDGIADLWTTTASTTAGLEFVPGRKDGVGTPSVVGTGGWQAIKAIS